MKYYSNNLQDTENIAFKVASSLTGGEILLLNGDLGAGKTTFTKGLAKALGVTTTVKSPTFTLLKCYSGNLSLYHFDLYRIGNSDEVEELGFEDYLADTSAVCVIEWNKFEFLDKKRIINVNISYAGENSRIFDIVRSL